MEFSWKQFRDRSFIKLSTAIIQTNGNRSACKKSRFQRRGFFVPDKLARDLTNGQPQLPLGAVVTEACIPLSLPGACNPDGYDACWRSTAQCDIQPTMKLPIAICSTKKVQAIAQRLLKIPNTTTESVTITIATVNFIGSRLQVQLTLYLSKTHENPKRLQGKRDFLPGCSFGGFKQRSQ
jgi:hypothetical protein